MASCLDLKVAGLKRLAHSLLAHPSPRWKHARCAAVSLARARPASTSASQPVDRNTYVDLAAAASPYSTELGLLPLPRCTANARPLRFLN